MKRLLVARGLTAAALLAGPVLVQQARTSTQALAAHAGLSRSNTLVIAEAEQPKSFDAVDTDDSTVNRMTIVAYDALLQYKAGTSKPVSDLATSYRVAPDGKTYHSRK